MNALRHPRLCFVGNMLGLNPGYVTTQGQIAADLFAREGYEVITVSSKINRVYRLLDIIKTISKNAGTIDLLILEVYSGAGLIIADVTGLLCKLFKIPLISVLHGGDLPNFIERYPRWTKRLLKRADILIAPSPFLAREMERLNFQVEVIPNILDLELYPFKLRRKISPKLIWMRSFHPLYNPQMAVRAFAKIHQVYPEATLVMAGADKGLESEIKEMVHQLGLQEAVRFPGFLGMSEKIKEFSEANIYLNTNKIDNMPVSVVEACAMGLPVVATKVGGLPYLISHGQNGLLVSDNNVDEMVSVITTLLSDSKLTERISKNGRLLAERSNWEIIRCQWEDLFAQVINYQKVKSQTNQLI